jgi:hypothetical protein
MRIRTLAIVTLLGLPAALDAQLRLPGRGRRGPAPLPPEAPGIARQTAYQRSRWTSEGFFSISHTNLPIDNGATLPYTTFGSGARSDYRFTDSWSLGMNLTTSVLGDPSTTNTAELGLRFRPLPDLERVRLFVDAAGAYLSTSNSFAIGGTEAELGFAGASQLSTQYSRGAGAVGGVGGEFSVTDRVSITTSGSVLRARQSVHRMDPGNGIPVGSTYWSTTYRLFVGLGYNFGRTTNLPQNPTR